MGGIIGQNLDQDHIDLKTPFWAPYTYQNPGDAHINACGGMNEAYSVDNEHFCNFPWTTSRKYKTNLDLYSRV